MPILLSTDLKRMSATQASSKLRKYKTTQVTTKPKIDGHFKDSAWQQVVWSSGFTSKGQPVKAGYGTRFKLIYDQTHIYIAIRCWDKQPDKIPLYPSPRDNPSNDWVEVDFDTNLDKKTGVAFAVSPYGVRTDMFIVGDDDNFIDAWHPKWEVKTRVDDAGWTAEMKIPFDQLNIRQAGQQQWGLQVTRRIIRFDEVSNWQPLKPGQKGWVSRFGRLEGLHSLPKFIPEKIRYNPAQKIPAIKLKADLKLFRQTLEGIYPSLYWYRSTDQIAALFKKVEDKLTQPLTELEFYRLMAPIMAYIGDGHASVRLSNSFERHSRDNIKKLPLGVWIVKNRVYVTDNWSGDQSLHKGDEIIAINEVATHKILNQMRSLVTSDGYTTTFKNDRLGNNFARYLSYIWGDKTAYRLKLVKANHRKTIVKTVKTLLKSKFYPNTIQRKPQKLRKKRWNYHLLNANTAYVSLRDFGGKNAFRKFINRTFATINQQTVKNLVLDLRYNYGGQERNGVHLCTYLAKHNFRYYSGYETNTKLSEKALSEITCCISNEELDYLRKVSTTNKAGVQCLTNYALSGYADPLVAYVPHKNAFQGKVYVLINGATFSTSSDVCSILHNNQRAVFIGEETGGGYFGNTSGIIKSLILPHSRLIVRIPLIKYLNARSSNRGTLGRGIIPDHIIQPSAKDIHQNHDRVLNFAQQLIKQEE